MNKAVLKVVAVYVRPKRVLYKGNAFTHLHISSSVLNLGINFFLHIFVSFVLGVTLQAVARPWARMRYY